MQAGDILNYPYLWRWQKDRDELAGRKDRPVCVLLAIRSEGGLTHLALLAISSRPAGADQVAIEIPEIECRRAGLSEFKRAWITVSEYNYDIAERSFYLDSSQPVLGRFSTSFLRTVADVSAPLFQRSRTRIDRLD